MPVSRYRADRQVMFLRERAGKDIGATGTDNGSRRHVPPIMLLPIDPAPTHLGRHCISRNTPFPSITPLDKSGSREGYGGMHGWERMIIAEVGPLFLH